MATNINWPSTLPQQFLADNNFDEQPIDCIIRTSMDAATPKQRSRYTHAMDQRKGNMLMDATQVATLKDFYKNTLQNGALQFNMPIVGDNTQTNVVQFGAPYDLQYVGPKYQVSLQLMVMP